MQLAKALLLLPFLSGVDGCSGLGGHFSLINGCCGSLHCEKQGFLNWRCTGTEHCKAEGQTCDGPGLAHQTCCHGMKCERHFMGTTNKQCVKNVEPQCIHRGQICGCAGCLTQRCCGGEHCLDVGGQGGKKYCVNTRGGSFAEENRTELAEGQAVHVRENTTELAGGPGLDSLSFAEESRNELAEGQAVNARENITKLTGGPGPDSLSFAEHHCKAEGQTCDGPGLAHQTCCHGMKCERHFLGTTNKQCLKNVEPQCIHRGQICGCAGCLTQRCCGGEQCLDVGGQGGKKYCVNARGGSFVEENRTELAGGQAVNVQENTPAEFLP